MKKAFQFDIQDKKKKDKTFIQWKGTDICLDWYCDCGELNHEDGDFCYEVECPKCGAVYALGTKISLRKLDLTKEKRWRDD